MIEEDLCLTAAERMLCLHTRHELEWLYETLSQSKQHVEVGSLCGGSLLASCGGMAKSSVYAVELFESDLKICELLDVTWRRAVLTETIELIRRHSDTKIELMEMPSTQAAEELAQRGLIGSIDSVYIDADHRYESCLADIRSWLPLIRRGGIISGHDYWTGTRGVLKAVNEEIGIDNVQFVAPSRIWFWRKP